MRCVNPGYILLASLSIRYELSFLVLILDLAEFKTKTMIPSVLFVNPCLNQYPLITMLTLRKVFFPKLEAYKSLSIYFCNFCGPLASLAK